jgi:hypothetical protein
MFFKNVTHKNFIIKLIIVTKKLNRFRYLTQNLIFIFLQDLTNFR